MMAMMMTVTVFTSAFAGAAWAIYATVAPERARIGDLLRHGPVLSSPPLRPVAARSTSRDVRLRSQPGQPSLRAAA